EPDGALPYAPPSARVSASGDSEAPRSQALQPRSSVPVGARGVRAAAERSGLTIRRVGLVTLPGPTERKSWPTGSHTASPARSTTLATRTTQDARSGTR